MSAPGWLKGTLILVTTLAAGVFIGLTISNSRPVSHDAQNPRHHFLEVLRESLALDSVQEREVTAILARHQSAVDSVWQALQPHVRATLDSSLREIATVLRPDQLERFRRLIAARHPGALP